MKIRDKEIGMDNPVFIIAELGINHNGTLALAKDLIDVAVLAKCDAVKFQKRTIDVVYTKDELARPRDSPFGNTNGDLKRGLEFGQFEYEEIDKYCREKKIIWFASPWDEESVDFLAAFDIPAYKIASACVTDIGLLTKIRDLMRPVIMSTGGSSNEQIDRALGVLQKRQYGEPAILSCTALYPCSVGMSNLAKMDTLKKLYPDNVIGYSNHSPGLWMMLTTVAKGAKIVEFHLTLDRSMWGSDQSASIETGGAIKIVKEIRDFEKAMGNGCLMCTEEEKPAMLKLRRFNT